jgi:hypothetical protein
MSYEPERPVEPPEEESCYCPMCGAENPRKIIMDLGDVVGCDSCLDIRDAWEYFELRRS